MKYTIHLATDHAGFEKKEFLKNALAELGYTVLDHGAFIYDALDDYPDYISLAAAEISKNPQDRAIIFGGSGQGEAIAANRYPYVRATTYYHFDLDIIKLSREHNDANILSIGARFLSEQQIIDSVVFWLETVFTDQERHLRRIKKVDNVSIDGE